MHTDPPTSPRASAAYAAQAASFEPAIAAGSHGSVGSASHAQAYAQQQAIVPNVGNTSFVTGAYQLSGDPSIDRMIRLEHALKRFGAVR